MNTYNSVSVWLDKDHISRPLNMVEKHIIDVHGRRLVSKDIKEKSARAFSLFLTRQVKPSELKIVYHNY